MPAVVRGFVVRRHRVVLGVWLVVLCAAAVFGAGVVGRLSSGGDTEAGAESSRAAAVVRERLAHGGLDTVAVFRSERWTVDDPAFGQHVLSSLALLPPGLVVSAEHYWDTRNRALLSGDRHAAAVLLSLRGQDDSARLTALRTLRHALRADGMTIGYSGQSAFYADATDLALRDLLDAELYCAPVLFVLLLLIFRGLVAALLPLAVAGASIVLAAGVLRLVTSVMAVSVFTVNLVTMTALGLAVDYALLIVARFREELDQESDVPSALLRATARAGETVFFSGLTIAGAMLALTLLPFPYTRSIGVGGAVTVLLTVLTSLTALPAALALLGRRVNAWRMPVPVLAPRRRGGVAGGPGGAAGREVWARLGRAVVGRPVSCLLVALAGLALVTVPAAHARFGATDYRTLPATAPFRQATEALERDFPVLGPGQLQVVTELSHNTGSGAGSQALAAWQQRLSALPGAGRAQLMAASGRLALVLVPGPPQPQSRAAAALVRAVRALPAPDGGRVLVGGPSAATVDLLGTLRARLPLIGLCVTVTTFTLLVFAFGSIVVPLKALVTTALSLGASLAAVTWVFQDGHLSGWLGFRSNGYLGAFEPVIMLLLLFAMSIDYELFLLSRVREHYQLTGDNRLAVVSALRRTGPLIASAALLMLAVIAAFATSGVLAVKEIAVGAFVAVVVDVTVVRLLLVPAALSLLGQANWWLPGRGATVAGPRQPAASGEAAAAHGG